MGLEQNILKEHVSELPLREVIKAPPKTTVREAVALMRSKGLGCVVVVDAHDQPIGKFTERLLIGLLVNDPGAMDAQIGDHMAKTWRVVQADSPIVGVIDAMQQHNLRFIVVADAEGQAIALTGQRGLCEFIAEHFPRQVLTSRVGAKPSIDQREGA